MSERTIGALVTIGVVLLISLAQVSSPDMFDRTGGFGTTAFWLGLLAAIIGLILSIFVKTRQFAQGMLIGGGILMLIGFSLCSGGFGLIKS